MLTDIHTHLHHFSLEEINVIIKKCNEKGIRRIITCVHSKESLLKTIPILKSHNNIYLSSGVHPQCAFIYEKAYEEFIYIMEKIIDGTVAIGEIGFDIYPGNPPIEEQKEAFLRQLTLLKNHNIPLIIHCRNAFEELFHILEKVDNQKIILHSYSGGFKYLDRVIKKKYYVSFSGTVTFKRSSRLKKIGAMVPADRLLCETDSPFIPFEDREKEKRPDNLDLVLKALSEDRSQKIEELTDRINQNINSLFDFDKINKDREKWISLLEKSLL